MILEETVNKLIRDTVNLLLGIDGFAIKSKQKDAVKPNSAYADVDFISDTSISMEHRELRNREDEDLNEELRSARELMISISFHKDNAMDNARKVRAALARESVITLFRSAKVGLNRRSEVRDISEILENGWEDRAQFDLVLNAVDSDIDIITAINSVNIEAEYQIGTASVNFNIGVS